MARIFVVGLSVLPTTIVVMGLIIIVVKIDVKIATERTVLGIIDANAQDRLLAALTMKIVDPGLRPPGGRKTKGLQGMTMNGEEMTRGAMRKKIDTKTEMQGMRMGRVVGPVE